MKTLEDISDDDAVERCQEMYKHLMELPIEQRTTREVFWDREHKKIVLMGFTVMAKNVFWMGDVETVYYFRAYQPKFVSEDYGLEWTCEE
jgi:hypothetical protein